MATKQALLAQIVSDFDVLYHAYARAGLLAEDAQTEAAQKLLGSGDDMYRFKRAFLLTEALIGLAAAAKPKPTVRVSR